MDRNKASNALFIVASLGICLTIIGQILASRPGDNLYNTLGILQMFFFLLIVVAGFLYTCPTMDEQNQSQTELDANLPQTQMSCL